MADSKENYLKNEILGVKGLSFLYMQKGQIAVSDSVCFPNSIH